MSAVHSGTKECRISVVERCGGLMIRLCPCQLICRPLFCCTADNYWRLQVIIARCIYRSNFSIRTQCSVVTRIFQRRKADSLELGPFLSKCPCGIRKDNNNILFIQVTKMKIHTSLWKI